MGVNLFGLIFAGFSGLFLLVGAVLARKQARRLATFRPTPAVVVSSEVTASTGSKGGTNYSPDIKFSYTAGGKTFECDTPLAIGKMGSSGNWAQRIVDRYPAGAKTSAYVDPHDPTKAFLVREASFFPYIFILFPMIHFSIGLGMLLGGGDTPLCSPARAMLFTALAWNAAGILCMFHYRSAGGLMKFGTLVAFVVYGTVGFGLLITSSRLSDQIEPKPPATQPAEDGPEAIER